MPKKERKLWQRAPTAFFIAEKDLELRGPGEIFGHRQHGIPDMILADLVKHMDIMEKVRGEAIGILSEDPGLEGEELQPLRQKVEKLIGAGVL